MAGYMARFVGRASGRATVGSEGVAETALGRAGAKVGRIIGANVGAAQVSPYMPSGAMIDHATRGTRRFAEHVRAAGPQHARQADFLDGEVKNGAKRMRANHIASSAAAGQRRGAAAGDYVANNPGKSAAVAAGGLAATAGVAALSARELKQRKQAGAASAAKRKTTTTTADMGKLAKRDRIDPKYGRINSSVGSGSKLVAGIEHGMGLSGVVPVVGNIAGAYQGWKHQGRANKLRAKLGGSPESTPEDLDGRGARLVGALTGGTTIAGVATALGSRAVSRELTNSGRFGAGAAVRMAGGLAATGLGIAGAIRGHRRVRDSQIQTRDFEKGAPGGALRKSWAKRLPHVLHAIQASHAARDMQEEGEALPDSVPIEAVARLVGRAARLSRDAAGKRGAKPPAKAEKVGEDPSADMGKLARDPGAVLAKFAPRDISLAFAQLGRGEQTDILVSGGSVLAELAALDAKLATLPLHKHAGEIRAWIEADDEAELRKFWGLAARGLMAAGPMIGRVAGALRGAATAAGPALRNASAGAAMLGRAHADPAIRAGRAAAGYAAQGARAGRGYAARGGQAAMSGARAAAADPVGTAVRGGKAFGRHVYANRGGYGLTAGYELGSRMRGAE